MPSDAARRTGSKGGAPSGAALTPPASAAKDLQLLLDVA